MINGIGVVGWGVGGIEAEAGMLGQPVYFLTPDVVGVQPDRRAARRLHRDRPGADHHRNAAQGKSRRQVRRILRRRHRLAVADRPRHHRQHGAGIRRDHGLLPGRRRHHRILRRHRPHARRNRPPSRTTSRRRACSACRRQARSTTPAWCTLDLSTVTPVAGRPEASAGPYRTGQRQEQLHRTVLQADHRKRLQQERRTT